MKFVTCNLALLTALAIAGAPYQQPKGSGEQQSDGKTAKSNLIDINSASADELKSLPGMNDGYATAIINNRPYENKRQLLSRNIIPQASYEKIADRIVAK